MLTERQLQRHIATVRRKRLAAGGEDPDSVGFELREAWTGPSEIQVDDVTYAVKVARSSLEAREAVSGTREAGRRLVLLTSLPASELGADVMARLAKGRLEVLHVADMVREHFQVKDIDPRIRAERWLLAELLACPATNPPLAFLDLETAWHCVLAHRLNLKEARPDVLDLLRWTLQPTNVQSWRDAPTTVRDGALEWISQSAGTVGRAVLRMVDRGIGTDAIPMGLCLDAVAHASASQDAEKREAFVRLEYLAGGEPLGPGRAQWGEAARQALADLSPDELHFLSRRADEIADGCFISHFARHSAVMPAGLRQVLEDAAAALNSAVGPRDTASLPKLDALLESAGVHLVLAGDPVRVKRWRMARQLAGWILGGAPAFERLEDWARWYADEGCRVDLARKWCSYPDPHETWSESVASLMNAVSVRREEINGSFARVMADRLEQFTPADPLVLLEDVMPRIVLPLAEQAPVLMVVMDGLDRAGFLELQSSLDEQWRVASGASPCPIPIAPLPTVTEVCRTSLIGGRLAKGTSADERQSVDYMRIKGKRPLIFHKDLLLSDGAVSRDLREAVTSPACRLVIAVVNAVDDWLGKGDQTFVQWNVQAIPVLRSLLEIAFLQERTVVIASDHGHVIERGSRYIPGSGTERYRQPSLDVNPGEMKVKGSRVVDGPWVVATREDLRYTQGKRNGYHGGATPQEVLSVLAILTPRTR